MTKNTNLDRLVRYKSWADNIFYGAVSQLSDDKLMQQRPMLFGSIFNLLNHTYSMDTVWRAHLEGKPHHLDTRNPDNDSSFIALQKNQTIINSWFQNFVNSLNIDKHNDQVSFTFIGGGNGTMTISEIIQHTVNHATYHRGHIEGVLYQMAIEPPTTDLPVFIRTMKD